MADSEALHKDSAAYAPADAAQPAADDHSVPASEPAPAYNPLTDWGVYAAVFCGGFVGTLLRYALSVALPQNGSAGGVLYWGTFTANMLAAFVYAAVAAYLGAASWMGARRKERTNRALGMGLCGGLSTMSTFALEGFTQLRVAQDAADAASQSVGGTSIVVTTTGAGPTIPANVAFVIYVALTYVVGVLLAYAGSAVGASLGAKAAAGHSGPDSASSVADAPSEPVSAGVSMDVGNAADSDTSESPDASASSDASESEVK